MYYSVGNEEQMQIRVATATAPQGPFVDSGHRLTSEPFAIDPHVFEDEDGQRYLFYATDFYDHSHVGTGTVMAPLSGPFQLEGPSRPVTRPAFEWQVYDPQREAKGGLRWHTVEGPFVLKRKGAYYQMFSGGNWRNPGYGVAYGTAHNLEGKAEWQQVCDGDQVLPILRTVPGVVMGPGHNSVVRGPDNMELYCVYHRWGSGDGRQMAIDPLAWAGQRLLVLGPSHTPRQTNQPSFVDFLRDGDREALGAAWRSQGQWQVQKGAATAVAAPQSGAALACYDVGVGSFVAEVSVRPAGGQGAGLALQTNQGSMQLRLRLLPAHGQGMVLYDIGSGRQEEPFALSPAFDFSAYHLLRAEVDGPRVALYLDGRLCWRGQVTTAPEQLGLWAEEAGVAFKGLAITTGWNDLFTEQETVTGAGWCSEDVGAWRLEAGQLWFNDEVGESMLRKGPLLHAYELLVNARLVRATSSTGGYGFFPALTADGRGPLLALHAAAGGWQLRWQDGQEARHFALPGAFAAADYQQFRLRKDGSQLDIFWENRHIGSMAVTSAATQVGLFGRQGVVAFDQVRVTAI